MNPNGNHACINSRSIPAIQRLMPLALLVGFFLLVPSTHAQTFTMPPVVVSGVPFNVTVTSSTSFTSPATFSWGLNSCTCTVSPSKITFSGTSQTYPLTITGTPDNNLILQLVYGNTLDHQNFQLQGVTATKLTVTA